MTPSPLHQQVADQEEEFEDFAMTSIRQPGFLADSDDEEEHLQQQARANPIADPTDDFGPMTEASPDFAITPPGFDLKEGSGADAGGGGGNRDGSHTSSVGLTTTLRPTATSTSAQQQPSPEAIGFFGRLQRGKIPIPVIIRDPNLELAMDKLVVEPFRQFSEMVKDPKAKVVQPLRQFSETTSAQFKHQIERIERLGSHRPANLYDPATTTADHEDRQHAVSHMDRMDWKIRFMAFQVGVGRRERFHL